METIARAHTCDLQAHTERPTDPQTQTHTTDPLGDLSFDDRQYVLECNQHWRTMMTSDSELLVGLSDEELEALADSMLAPSAQARLDELLGRNAGNQLAADEHAELDRLLARVDHLTILKTRARYTLRQQAGATGA